MEARTGRARTIAALSLCLASGCGVIADLGSSYTLGEAGVDGSVDGGSGPDASSDSATADGALEADSRDSAAADATETATADVQPSDSTMPPHDGTTPPDTGNPDAAADSGPPAPPPPADCGGPCVTVVVAVQGDGMATVTLDDGVDQISFNDSSRSYPFQTPLQVGATYNVTVVQQPMGSFCIVRGGKGTAIADGVTVAVDCLNKVVFVTSQPSAGSLGGVAGGDSLCTTAAAANPSQLRGLFKAWLSDDTTSPSMTFTQAVVPYVLLTGTIVANDWTALVSGSLSAPIDVTEGSGAVPAGACVWTGTLGDGTSLAGSNCAGWTSAAASSTGVPGSTAFTSPAWTDDGCPASSTCDASNYLYCFQQ
jgi:hypothetical protein